jgi:tripartite-type tricarboxylate transporter receptor subunit TctC
MKRSLVKMLMAGGLLAFGAHAMAQSARPLKIVVPFAAGGAQDGIARYFSTKLTALLNVPVIVENRTGAGGLVAADAVAKSADGATLLLATGGAITIAPLLQPRLAYDPAKDLVPLSLVGDTPMTFAVRAESPFKTMGDAVRAARQQPGSVSYGSSGNGSVSHLTGALLGQAESVDLLHVPYRGAAPALVDLLGGQVSAVVTSASSIDPFVESGKARVLATFSRSRLPSLGSPPTADEALGRKGLDVPVWIGFMAPARVALDHGERIGAAILSVCGLPETREAFAKLGVVNECEGRDAFAKVLAEDAARWSRVLRLGNIKVE